MAPMWVPTFTSTKTVANIAENMSKAKKITSRYPLLHINRFRHRRSWNAKKYTEKMLGMKNHFDISGSIEIREVDIAGVACISSYLILKADTFFLCIFVLCLCILCIFFVIYLFFVHCIFGMHTGISEARFCTCGCLICAFMHKALHPLYYHYY